MGDLAEGGVLRLLDEISGGEAGGVGDDAEHPVGPIRPGSLAEEAVVGGAIPPDMPAHSDGDGEGLDNQKSASAAVAVGEGVNGLEPSVSVDGPFEGGGLLVHPMVKLFHAPEQFRRVWRQPFAYRDADVAVLSGTHVGVGVAGHEGGVPLEDVAAVR